jgi:hypothetical protein
LSSTLGPGAPRVTDQHLIPVESASLGFDNTAGKPPETRHRSVGRNGASLRPPASLIQTHMEPAFSVPTGPMRSTHVPEPISSPASIARLHNRAREAIA